MIRRLRNAAREKAREDGKHNLDQFHEIPLRKSNDVDFRRNTPITFDRQPCDISLTLRAITHRSGHGALKG
jgi:hypothetical protein